MRGLFGVVAQHFKDKTMNESNEEKFATYRGAGHVPMLAGVPLIPCLILFGSFIVSFFLFIMILDWNVFGIICCAVILSVGVWIRFECMFESRALEIRYLELKGLLLRIKLGVRVLEITSMKHSEKKEIEDVQRFIKEKSRI